VRFFFTHIRAGRMERKVMNIHHSEGRRTSWPSCGKISIMGSFPIQSQPSGETNASRCQFWESLTLELQLHAAPQESPRESLSLEKKRSTWGHQKSKYPQKLEEEIFLGEGLGARGFGFSRFISHWRNVALKVRRELGLSPDFVRKKWSGEGRGGAAAGLADL